VVWCIITSEDVVILMYYVFMEWYARSLLRIQIIHWSIEDESNLGNELYIRSSCQYCRISFCFLFVYYLEYLYNISIWKYPVPYSSVSCYNHSVWVLNLSISCNRCCLYLIMPVVLGRVQVNLYLILNATFVCLSTLYCIFATFSENPTCIICLLDL